MVMLRESKGEKSMKIIKKSNNEIRIEEAHGGSGSRKLLISDHEFGNVQGMTYGYLPVGNQYAWHNHDGIDEIMYVLKGTGIVKDEEGEYSYHSGDLFMYPANVYHEIYNNGEIESEYIFIRIHHIGGENNGS